jgi:hypothetical protein
MNDEIKQAADEFATHKKDCTCKGKHYNEDKAKGFIAGANYANEKCQEDIQRLTIAYKSNQQAAVMSAMLSDKNRVLEVEIERLKEEISKRDTLINKIRNASEPAVKGSVLEMVYRQILLYKRKETKNKRNKTKA